MRTITMTVYKFSELSNKAKERAYQWMLENFEYGWSEENRKTLEAFADIFPVKIKNWEYGYRNYVDFEFTEDENIANLNGVRLLKYIYNNYFKYLYKGKFYYKNGKFRHSKVILENCCALTGYHIDDDILKPIYGFLKNPVNHITFYDLMNDCLQSWIIACKNDLEACQTMEYMEEHADINKFEFNEAGDFTAAELLPA